jgi:hypothetical protein
MKDIDKDELVVQFLSYSGTKRVCSVSIKIETVKKLKNIIGTVQKNYKFKKPSKLESGVKIDLYRPQVEESIKCSVCRNELEDIQRTLNIGVRDKDNIKIEESCLNRLRYDILNLEPYSDIIVSEKVIE